MAPLSGVTDVAFRRIARGSGPGLVVSEMVASDDSSAAPPRRGCARRARGLPRMSSSSPAASRTGWPRRRARRSARRGDHRHQHGLPGEEGHRRHAGSALMRDLDLARRLIDATVKAVLGAGHAEDADGLGRGSAQRARACAAAAKALGVKMVTVHGRTRCQFYKGSADWTAHRARSRTRSRSR